jgi:hypothetical protein
VGWPARWDGGGVVDRLRFFAGVFKTPKDVQRNLFATCVK